MGRGWFSLGAPLIVLASACGSESDPGPVAGMVATPPPPVTPDAGPPPGGMGGMPPPTGGTAAPIIPGLCDTSAWPADSTMYEQALLAALNAERTSGRGCAGATIAAPVALTDDMSLQLVARCHAQDMSTRGMLTLDAADGSTTHHRAVRAGYSGTSTGMAITASARDAAMVLEGLLVEASVCEKLLDPKWVHVGVGASATGDTGKRYVAIVTGF